ncbi:MAG TPA: ABC transporter permease [Thermoplasmata archaeon]|nr:ABC transporter permease [Thermoplasmata archaeon]
MRMWIYIVRRLILVVPIVIGVMTITFSLVSALPIQDRLISAFGAPPKNSPCGYSATCSCNVLHINKTGDCPNPLYVRDTHKLGLDQPIFYQWGLYIEKSLTFQWGYVDNHSGAASTYNAPIQGQQVVTVLSWLLPYTLELAVFALVIILIVSIPLGNLSAVYRNRPIDQASRVISFSGYALPGFLLGTLLLMAFVISVGPAFKGIDPTCKEPFYQFFYGSWPSELCFPDQKFPSWLTAGVISSPTGFPTVDALIHGQGWLALDTIIRMILPALVIAYGTIAGLLRFVRNSMLEVMNLDFVRTARSKGVPENVVISKHAGRNSLNVTITVLGLTFAFFIGGFPVVETIFNLSGVGRIFVYALLSPYDFGLIFGSTLLFTFLVVFANIIVDVLYAYLDPRVRLG